MASSIEKTNAALFVAFRAQLGAPKNFNMAAQKLAKWARDRRAYYEAARPQIVDMLTIAEKTVDLVILEENSRSPNAMSESTRTMLESFITLMRAIEPFVGEFRERELRKRVRSILASLPAREQSLRAPPANQEQTSNASATVPPPTPVAAVANLAASSESSPVVSSKPSITPPSTALQSPLNQTVPVPENPSGSVKLPKGTYDLSRLIALDLQSYKNKLASVASATAPPESSSNASAPNTPSLGTPVISETQPVQAFRARESSQERVLDDRSPPPAYDEHDKLSRYREIFMPVFRARFMGTPFQDNHEVIDRVVTDEVLLQLARLSPAALQEMRTAGKMPPAGVVQMSLKRTRSPTMEDGDARPQSRRRTSASEPAETVAQSQPEQNQPQSDTERISEKEPIDTGTNDSEVVANVLPHEEPLTAAEAEPHVDSQTGKEISSEGEPASASDMDIDQVVEPQTEQQTTSDTIAQNEQHELQTVPEAEVPTEASTAPGEAPQNERAEPEELGGTSHSLLPSEPQLEPVTGAELRSPTGSPTEAGPEQQQPDHTELDPEPLPEFNLEPSVDRQPESLSEPLTKPIIELIGPSTEGPTEPRTEPSTEPLAQPRTDSLAEPTTEPVVAESLAQATSEPLAETTTEPVAEPHDVEPIEPHSELDTQPQRLPERTSELEDKQVSQSALEQTPMLDQTDQLDSDMLLDPAPVSSQSTHPENLEKGLESTGLQAEMETSQLTIENLDTKTSSRPMQDMETIPNTPMMETWCAKVGLTRSGTIHTSFEVRADQAAALRRWVKRFEEFDPAQPLLICEVRSHRKQDAEKDPSDLMRFPLVWPTRGMVNIRFGEDRVVFLARDQYAHGQTPIDISHLISEGMNDLIFTQITDVSHLVFTIHARPPSQAEMQDLEKYHQGLRSWKNALAARMKPERISPAFLSIGTLLKL